MWSSGVQGFLADFVVIAAMKPCPRVYLGYHDDPEPQIVMMISRSSEYAFVSGVLTASPLRRLL
jgi:hypothetical protein